MSIRWSAYGSWKLQAVLEFSDGTHGCRDPQVTIEASHEDSFGHCRALAVLAWPASASAQTYCVHEGITYSYGAQICVSGSLWICTSGGYWPTIGARHVPDLLLPWSGDPTGSFSSAGPTAIAAHWRPAGSPVPSATDER